MNENVYQHFRKEEHPFVEQVNDWLNQVLDQYSPVLTNFLDPRQKFIIESLIGRSDDVSFAFFGGSDGAERVRGLIYPDYFTPKEEDYELALIEIIYPSKFATLSHGQILGSLMGIGLERAYFGDILTDGDTWQFFVQEDKKNYLMTQLDRIGRIKIKLKDLELDELVRTTEEWLTETITVSSLRLDVIIATTFKISRQRAKVLVEGNKVKVNWTEVTKLDYLIESLDVISIRGFGRIQLQTINGRTKKDKIRLEIGVLRK